MDAGMVAQIVGHEGKAHLCAARHGPPSVGPEAEVGRRGQGEVGIRGDRQWSHRLSFAARRRIRAGIRLASVVRMVDQHDLDTVRELLGESRSQLQAAEPRTQDQHSHAQQGPL